MPTVYVEIYKIVQQIPRGRVLTYGVISHMIGGRMSAQGVGWALKALGSKKQLTQASKRTTEVVYNSVTVPWQRVVNAQGGTSTHKVGLPPDLQREMLESEGIQFNDENKLDLDEYLWREGLNESWKSKSQVSSMSKSKLQSASKSKVQLTSKSKLQPASKSKVQLASKSKLQSTTSRSKRSSGFNR